MLILLISMISCIVFILAASILIIVRQPQKQEGELIRLSETIFTAVMGSMPILLGFSLLYFKYVNSSVGGTDQASYVFVGGFASLCVAGGCVIMLYTFIKKVIAFDNRILYITILGQHKELYWNEINEIKVPLFSNKATLVGKNIRLTVGGEPKTYKKFIKIIQEKIGHRVGREVFQKLLNRFMF